MKKDRSATTSKQSLRATNEAASESEERERRAKNVVIRGIPPSATETDLMQVNSFLDAVGADVHATRVQRIKSATQRDAVPAILVLLDSRDKQQRVLQHARHHGVTKFSNVFAHEDRTKAQQLQFSECAKAAKTKNAILERSGLDPLYRYVVRGDRVRCIDLDKSREERTSVYVTEADIKSWLNLARAITNGSVSNTRSSMRQSTAVSAAIAATTIVATTTAATAIATTTSTAATNAAVATATATVNDDVTDTVNATDTTNVTGTVKDTDTGTIADSTTKATPPTSQGVQA